MADIIQLCREAWSGSRTELQPEYDDLAESYRDMLTKRAEAVLAGEYVSEGPFQGFEVIVLDSMRHAGEKAAEEKAKKKVAPKKKAAPKAEPSKKPVKVIKKAEKKSTQKGAKKR